VVVLQSSDAELTVRSALTVAEYRRDEQRMFAGYAKHRLSVTNSSFRILMKRVDIINCDADTGHSRISVPL
jgi:3-phenylpropionate/cinnamic acid dioxygenase small subunit